MSELQFPKYPIVGQEYDFPPYKYYWDGAKWKTKGIGYNPVNDLRDELEPRISDNESKVFEALKRSYADAGLNLVEGSFEEGGELLVASDVMITASGVGYSWGGPEFPHNVAPKTDPAAVGSGYVLRTDVLLRSELASDLGGDSVKYKIGPLAAAIGQKLAGVIDAYTDCGCIPDDTGDQSGVMQAAVELASALKRPLVWRQGTYLGRIDFSAITSAFRFVANGSVFRPYSFSQGEVFYCKKSSTYPTVSGEFSGLPVVFEDVHVSAKLLSASSDSDPNGHADYGVNFICTSATWFRSSWQYGKIASFRGYYHQYGVFYDCLPGATVYDDSAIGMLLEGNTSSEASNENRIYGPKLFSNKNGLVIKGGIKNRIYTPTIQDTRLGGNGGIFLTTDASGFGADGTEIHGAYAEINNGAPAIKIGVAPNTVINGVEFLNAGESIVSTHCYNLTLRDVNGYGGGSVTLAHPSASTDMASVTVTGGNIKPTLNIAHNGPSAVSIDQPSIKHQQKSNLVGFTGKSSRNSVPVIDVDMIGAATAVPKGVSTPIASINLDTFGTSAYRVLVGKLELRAWDDTNSTSNYGYSARVQSHNIFISTNGDGVPKIFLSDDAGGVDLGLSTSFQAIGAISLSGSVSGNKVTISATWNGSGTGAGGMTTATIEYKLRCGGTNSVWM